ncbi:MAG: hypothetical protein IPO92_02955 [Saprospiraceae bacterium]|nr:hypothetical protein [Saprospiraceae bacterium]
MGLSEVKAHLASSGVNDAVIGQYAFIQQRSELARFAGQFGDIDGVYEMATQLIMDLES